MIEIIKNILFCFATISGSIILILLFLILLYKVILIFIDNMKSANIFRKCMMIYIKRNKPDIKIELEDIDIKRQGIHFKREERYIVKTADEMFEELEYKKKNPDFIISRFWEQWKNENLEKTISFNTEYKIVDVTDENGYGIAMQELQAINKKCQELGWI